MKKQILKEEFKIMHMWRLNNTSAGNHRYFLALTDASNNLCFATTTSNSAAGYKLSDQYEGRKARIQFHFTRKTSAMKIDDVELID